MLNQEKFCYKKSFANNNNDSKIIEMLFSVKLETQDLLMAKKDQS